LSPPPAGFRLQLVVIVSAELPVFVALPGTRLAQVTAPGATLTVIEVWAAAARHSTKTTKVPLIRVLHITFVGMVPLIFTEVNELK
jgi:hypothetical protein